MNKFFKRAEPAQFIYFGDGVKGTARFRFQGQDVEVEISLADAQALQTAIDEERRNVSMAASRAAYDQIAQTVSNYAGTV